MRHDPHVTRTAYPDGTDAYTATQAEVARRPDRCCDLCVATAEGGALAPTAIKTATTIVDDADGVPAHLVRRVRGDVHPP